MNVELVVPFTSLDRGSLSLAGGKAANLGELTRAGFPVPPGFCVTTGAYALALVGSALSPVLEALAQVDRGDTAVLGEHAGRARRALLEAPIPPEVERACSAAYRALGDAVPVAVRSSATAEDLPEASFAGQQDTFLNVVGEAEVLQAVHRCWASLFTERAVIYRAKNGIDSRAVQLAVVVQRLVPAAVAGVLFSANPVTGRRRRVVIDASPGLGEAVVSGAVNPDHFEVDVATGEILERRLGDKRIAIEPIAGGGTRRVEQEEAPARACLSDSELVELARLGAKVEAHYGAPQDLEWALDAERALWLLQARPITTLFPLPGQSPATGDALRVYFNINVAQGVFRPFTPMGIQAWRMFGAGGAELLGFPSRGRYLGPPMMVDAAGRLFFDITVLLRSRLGRLLAPAALRRIEARSVGPVEALLKDPRLPATPTKVMRLVRTVLRVLWRLRLPVRVVRNLRDPAGARARVQAKAEEALAVGVVPAGSTAAEKLEAVERLLYQGFRLLPPHFLSAVIPGLASLGLTRWLTRGIASREQVDTVLRGLPHNPTTEMDLALWQLAVRLRRDPESAQTLTGIPPAELSRRYRAGTLPAELQRELAGFLGRYGFRGVAEIDLGVERWEDNPEHLLGSLANYLSLPEGGWAPDVKFREGAQQAEAMVAELSRRARAQSCLRGRLVRFFLSRVRELAGVREAPKFHAVRLLGRVRAHLLDVGKELALADRLDAADGIFFLSLPEARAAVAGDDVRALVRERRATYARELKRPHLPRILLSDGTEPVVPPAPTGERGLTGAPASAGSISGKARVILDPNGARLEPGEILVAPSTDPGWTPLFLTAGGLVMEMGGAMSHGAVVAREYGIPAVVGVAHATERISTGQLITVDGAAGTVTLPQEDEGSQVLPATAT